MPTFKDLSSDSGLAELNKYLASRSYIEGYKATQRDMCVFKQININVVDTTKFPNVTRWYSHLNSFSTHSRKGFGGDTGDKKEEKKEDVKGNNRKESKRDVLEKEKSKKEESDDEGAAFDPFAEESDSIEKTEEAVEVDSDDERMKSINAKAAIKLENDKKNNKVAPVLKSSLVLDIKPIGSETDMAQLEADVKKIHLEGLIWAGSQFVDIAYGIKKLRIIATIVDEFVAPDDLREKIESIEDVQSTDIYAWNKL